MINKKLIVRSLIIILIFAGLASCDDEPLNTDFQGNTPGNSNFQVDIDGNTFFADISGMLTQNGVTTIIGSKNNGTKVRMEIQGSGTGSFTLNGSSEGTASYLVAGEAPYTMENVDSVGVLTISKYDVESGLASGTFSFRAARTTIGDTIPTDSTSTDSTGTTAQTLNFTNGVFNNISLETDETPTPPDTTTSAFHVELDGDLYNGNNIQSAILPNQGLVIETSNDVKQFILQVFNPTLGEFALGDGPDAEGLILYNVDSTDAESPVFTSTMGTVNISEIDEENQLVSGTFSGTLGSADDPENTIEMTNGVFENIPYITQGDGGGGDVEIDSLVATIDGQHFNASDIATSGVGDALVGIIGTDELNDELQLNVPNDVTPGTYTITTSGAYSAFYRKQDPETEEQIEYTSFNNSGNIIISSRAGDVISGSFSFSVKNDAGEVLQVTDGHFSVDIGL